MTTRETCGEPIHSKYPNVLCELEKGHDAIYKHRLLTTFEREVKRKAIIQGETFYKSPKPLQHCVGGHPESYFCSPSCSNLPKQDAIQGDTFEAHVSEEQAETQLQEEKLRVARLMEQRPYDPARPLPKVPCSFSANDWCYVHQSLSCKNSFEKNVETKSSQSCKVCEKCGYTAWAISAETGDTLYCAVCDARSRDFATERDSAREELRIVRHRKPLGDHTAKGIRACMQTFAALDASDEEVASLNNTTGAITEHHGSKYLRLIHSAVEFAQCINVDVYAVLDAFSVSCPGRQQAIKKLLCAGLRGKGSQLDDLIGAQEALTRAIELQKGREGIEYDYEAEENRTMEQLEGFEEAVSAQVAVETARLELGIGEQVEEIERLRNACPRYEEELVAIDIAFGNASALDDCETRPQKIQKMYREIHQLEAFRIDRKQREREHVELVKTINEERIKNKHLDDQVRQQGVLLEARQNEVERLTKMINNTERSLD